VDREPRPLARSFFLGTLAYLTLLLAALFVWSSASHDHPMTLADSCRRSTRRSTPRAPSCSSPATAAIRAGDREGHRRRMLAAFAVSGLFLVSYLTRVLLTGTHRFPGEGWLRIGYLVLLASHTALAAACLPLILGALNFGLRGDFGRHRRIARWTCPRGSTCP